MHPPVVEVESGSGYAADEVVDGYRPVLFRRHVKPVGVFAAQRLAV